MKKGYYSILILITLFVTSGFVYCNPNEQSPIEKAEIIKSLISELPTSNFDGQDDGVRENRRNTLLNRLDVVIMDIQTAETSVKPKFINRAYQSAIDQLLSILNITDGCIKRGTYDIKGSGYTPDWIITCESQTLIYPLLRDLVATLEALIQIDFTIQIGVIFSGTPSLEKYSSLFKEIIEPDINEYLTELSYSRSQVEFVMDDAAYSSVIHLEKVQMFHDMGIDLLIGGYWSSQASYCLDYVNENDMLLFSPSSTFPALAIPSDNFFRLALDDSHEGKIIAEMILSKGISSAIVIQRDDLWGDAVYSAFEALYQEEGGSILTRLQYDPSESDFSVYLETAENIAQTVNEVAILIITFDEAVEILIQAGNYPMIYYLSWFGTQSTALSDVVLEWAPEQAAHLSVYSPLAAPIYSIDYYEMAERFENLIGSPMTFYDACQIDIAWLITQTLIEINPSNPEMVSAVDIIQKLPEIASDYIGYSGWCALNDAGDRYESDYDIWGYIELGPGEYNFKQFGHYSGLTGEIQWVA